MVISATHAAEKLLVHRVIHRNWGERNQHQMGKERGRLIGEE